MVLPDDPEQLVAALEAAGTTLLASRGRGIRPAGMRSWWPEVVHAAEEAYGYDDEDLPVMAPSARSITAMDSAHDWIRLIPLDRPRAGEAEIYSPHGGAQLRRIVWLRSLVDPRSGKHLYSWRRIGRRIGASHESVRQWHGQAMGRILRALHRPAVEARAAILFGRRVVPCPPVHVVATLNRSPRARPFGLVPAAHRLPAEASPRHLTNI